MRTKDWKQNGFLEAERGENHINLFFSESVQEDSASENT